MSFTTITQLKSSKKRYEVNFAQTTVNISATLADLWSISRSNSDTTYLGNIATIPDISTPRQLDYSVEGSIPHNAPTSVDSAFIDYISVGPADTYNDTGCSFVLHDRLVDFRGISPVSTTPQSVGSISLPRYTDGTGVVPVIRKMVNNTTNCTFTISYTNQNGTTGRTSLPITIVNTATITISYIIPLQAGDTGVRSIESITFSSTSASGEFAIFLMKPICIIGSNQKNVPTGRSHFDFVSLGLPEIKPNSHLSLLQLNSSGTNQFTMSIGFVQ